MIFLNLSEGWNMYPLFFTLYIVRQENLTLKQGARVYRVPGAFTWYFGGIRESREGWAGQPVQKLELVDDDL